MQRVFVTTNVACSLPGDTPGYRVKVTLLSGNTAVYDIEQWHVPPPRPGYACADFDRAHTAVIQYGYHIATHLRGADGALHWIKTGSGLRGDLVFPDNAFDEVPDLYDLMWELA